MQSAPTTPPHASFEKEVEYISAPFGILGLETAWGLTGREVIADGTLTTAQAVHKMTITPRAYHAHRSDRGSKRGAHANLTIFDADTEWVFEKDDIQVQER